MASRFPELNDREWLYNQYVIINKSCRVIAEELGCCEKVVQRWKNRHGIPPRDRTGKNGDHWQGGPVECKCAECGAVLMRQPRRISTSEHQFCSYKCSGIWRSKHIAGENHPNWKGVKCHCAQCGALLMRPQLLIDKHKHQFCSRECVSVWRTTHMTKENSPGWKGGASTERGEWEQNGGRQWKQSCRKRDNYTCQLCGKVFDKRSNSLQVHHKASFADHPELRSVVENGICLCERCHIGWIHSNEGELFRYRWEQEAIAELMD